MEKISASKIGMKNIPKAATNAAFVCKVMQRFINGLLPKDVKGKGEVVVVSYNKGKLKIATQNTIYSQEIKIRQLEVIEKLRSVKLDNYTPSIVFTHNRRDETIY